MLHIKIHIERHAAQMVQQQIMIYFIQTEDCIQMYDIQCKHIANTPSKS